MNPEKLIYQLNLVSSLDVADGVEQQHWLVIAYSWVFVIPVAEFVFLVPNPFEIQHNIIMSIFDVDTVVPTFEGSHSFDVLNFPALLFDTAKYRLITFRYFLSVLVDFDSLDFTRVNED